MSFNLINYSHSCLTSDVQVRQTRAHTKWLQNRLFITCIVNKWLKVSLRLQMHAAPHSEHNELRKKKLCGSGARRTIYITNGGAHAKTEVHHNERDSLNSFPKLKTIHTIWRYSSSIWWRKMVTMATMLTSSTATIFHYRLPFRLMDRSFRLQMALVNESLSFSSRQKKRAHQSGSVCL